MSETEQLLPCPFCGSIAIAEHEQDCRDAETYYWFVCGGCGCETEGAHGRKSAIASWNTRASPAPAASRNARRAVAVAIAKELARQDYNEDVDDPFSAGLEGEMTWSYIDQGEVDFGLIADRVLESLAALPDAPVPAKDGEGEG